MLYLCVLTAELTHPLLDLCTSYGTQILAPLVHTRFAVDSIAIVDLIYTSLLLLTLIACYVARRIARGPSRRATLVIGWTGFLLATLYIGAGRVLHDRAVATARQLAGGETIVRADAYPMVGTIFLWRTVLETPDRWIVARVHSFSGANPATLRRSVAPKVASPWIERAMQEPDAQTFAWFTSSHYRATYTRLDGQHVVQFSDLRYGERTESMASYWSLVVTFDAEGHVLHTQRVHSDLRVGMLQRAQEAWADLWNP
jgi:inner membrane protein